MTDYSIYADFLARLQAATSQEEKSWMLMEFSFNQLSPTMREAVWAAAIPHQFDEKFLRTLLENNLTAEDWKTLLSQSYLEHLWNGGYAVHESTRKLLLAKLFQDDPQRYRELNRRAANYCEQQNQEELRWRVATLYHQALANLEGIAFKINNQASDWHNDRFQLDKVEALIRPLLEEVKAQRVSDAVTAQVFLFQGVLDDFYGRPFKVKEYLTQATQLFQQLQDEPNEAESIFRLGVVHLNLAEYKAAWAQVQQALFLFQQIGDKRGEANCIISLGDVYLMLSDYETALTQYQQALPLFQQMGDKRGEANCIISLGDVYLMLSDYEAARTQYQQVLPLFQQIGDKRTEAYCVRQLAQVLAEQGQIEEAIHTLQHAAELYHTIGSVVNEAGCFKRIANIYHDQKRYEDALLAYQQAIDIYPNSAWWYTDRAQIYIDTDKYKLAIQDVEKITELNPNDPYILLHRGVIALWQHQPQIAVDLLQSATQQRPKDGGFQRILALALLANGNSEAFATMETGLKLTYRKKDIERTLEELDKLVRIYGERAEFTQMREVLTNYLNQHFQH